MKALAKIGLVVVLSIAGSTVYGQELPKKPSTQTIPLKPGPDRQKKATSAAKQKPANRTQVKTVTARKQEALPEKENR